MIWIGDAVLIGILAGILSLDRVAFLQTMVSRPLVACAAAGAVVGNVELGLRCGLILELVWLMELPVGAWVPPDDTLAAVLSVVFSAAAPPQWSLAARSALGILSAVPFGVLGRQLDVWVRNRNAGLLTKARDVDCRESLGMLHLVGAVRFSVASALAAGFGSFVGCAVIRWTAPQLSRDIEIGLEFSAAMLPLVGVAAVLASLRGRRNALWFGAGVLGGVIGFGGPSSGQKVSWLR